MYEVKCFQCSKKLNFDTSIGRSFECQCGADVRCCYNCKFFSDSSHNQCLETQADKVAQKDRGNFCGYFSVKSLDSKGDSSVVDPSNKGELASELREFLSKKPTNPFS